MAMLQLIRFQWAEVWTSTRFPCIHRIQGVPHMAYQITIFDYASTFE
jgi:hypothetical protein